MQFLQHPSPSINNNGYVISYEPGEGGQKNVIRVFYRSLVVGLRFHASGVT